MAWMDDKLAAIVGVKAALVFQYIAHNCEYNEVEQIEADFHDGRYWSFNSIKGLKAHFPYMSEKEIRGAIEKLEEAGALLIGSFNKSPYDRTKWYAISDAGREFYRALQNGKLDLPTGANGGMPVGANRLARRGEPIPVNNLPVNKEIPVNKRDNRENAKKVIDYLNEHAGSKYRYSESSLKHIIARLNEGFTVDDCYDVIDKKCSEWLRDERMEKYLRPETLFGPKFENYLNQKTAVNQGKDMSYEEIDKMLKEGGYEV